MSYLNFKNDYNLYPETDVEGFGDQAWSGYPAVVGAIAEKLGDGRIVVLDCYPGVDCEKFAERLKSSLKVSLSINMEDLFYPEDRLTELMKDYLTDDRVRGVMYQGTVLDFLDQELVERARGLIDGTDGRVLIYGFGAALVSAGDVLAYADLSRWEIQLRYRKGMPNFKQENYDEDILRKYKRGYFIEWRIADRHKKSLYDRMDFFIDANSEQQPNMVTGEGLRAGLRSLTGLPFRLVPYFDPGVWGGQWMKEVCNLDPSQKNYAWSFDGVPEENSILLRFGDVRIESPAMNLVQYLPEELLGKKTFGRFGAEYPIRFDFLDTMGGEHLSLQVHPAADFIKSRFGMAYTQDESYYILDSGADGGVYLGLKEGVNPGDMLEDLKKAERGEAVFPADQYINWFPAKKHDHFLIPAGTVHCATKNCMILEISATPYIFTFKLWDWNRVGLDGKPRPIHLSEGEKAIQFDRDTGWVKNNLINRFETVADNADYKEVKTGLHQLQFIETHVFDIKTAVHFTSDGEVSQWNLVEGKGAIVESDGQRFKPFPIHYAETFIIPANAGDYRIRPMYEGEVIKVIRAAVRG